MRQLFAAAAAAFLILAVTLHLHSNEPAAELAGDLLFLMLLAAVMVPDFAHRAPPS